MADSLHPHEGVRVLLEREADIDRDGSGDGPPRYRGVLYFPDARSEFGVSFDEGGHPVLVPGDNAAAASAAAEKLLVAIARTVARHALAESPPAWPRRVLRWRKLVGG